MGSWIGGFVNAGLVAGVGLASVPLIIHLLNRQRHKPVPWAAMRFVLAAYRKTRRRVQLENLLLLMLRMAAVALLALAVSRPFAGANSPLAHLSESRRDVVLIVDGSASMGWRDGLDSVFDRAVARARDVLRSLDAGRGDRVRLLFAGAYPRMLSWTTPDQALSMLDALQVPTDEALDLAAALGDVLEHARAEGSTSKGAQATTLEVRLFTDMQRRAFLPDEAALESKKPGSIAGSAPTSGAAQPAGQKTARAALSDELDKLTELGIKVIVEGFGGSQPTPPNMGIGAVEPVGRILGPGMPADIGIEVRNFGPSPKSGLRVVLDVDGERRPNQTIDVPARGHATAMFSVAFKNPGEHVLTAKLDEGDKLAIDNVRSRVVTVPPPVRVLLVDGAPGAVIEEDEIGFLQAVLEPPGDDQLGSLGRSAPFEPRVVQPDDLGGSNVDLAAFDVIWLANVESLPTTSVDKLEAAIAGGRALVISLGDRVDPTTWNARFFRADGTGLLPAALDARLAVKSRADAYWRVKQFDETHPALAFFADERFKPLFTEVPVYEFFGVRPLANAHVLAALDDDGGHPLLVERAYDRGRVFLWTTTIDSAWTRLPESPATLVPLVHEWLRYAARAEESPRNVMPGSPLAAEVTLFPRALALVRPDGSRRTLDGEPEARPGGHWRLPVVPGKDTEKSGLYRLEMEGAPALSFAVSIDPLEGDLDRISAGELHDLYPAFVTFESRDEGGADPNPPQRGELWRGLAIACFAALVMESLWAAWIGRKRSVRA